MNAAPSTLNLGSTGPSLPAGPAGLRPRAADGWGPGVVLALGVHLMLVAALALGVRWKIANPEPVEAEVWAEIPRAVAPEAPPPPPVPQEPTPQTAEPPAQQVAQAEPPPPAPEPIPDLVVRKAPVKKPPKKEPKHHEPREVFESTPPKHVSKVPPKESAPPKPEVKKPAAAVAAATKPVPSKATSDDSIAQAAAEREAQRRANLQRMMSDLGSLGTSNASAGPSAAYAGRIKARIKPNIVFTENVNGNPLAVVEVRCGPDGRIVSRKLLEPSGVASWDEAVLRALDRTEVLPADESGRVQRVLQLEFRPKDF